MTKFTNTKRPAEQGHTIERVNMRDQSHCSDATTTSGASVPDKARQWQQPVVRCTTIRSRTWCSTGKRAELRSAIATPGGSCVRRTDVPLVAVSTQGWDEDSNLGLACRSRTVFKFEFEFSAGPDCVDEECVRM